MVFSLNGSEYERHRFIDDTIAVTREMLDDPALQKKEGVSTEAFSEIIDQLYIPNIVGTQLQVPEQFNHNRSIAITAVRRREALVAKGVINELHYKQEAEFLAFIDSYSTSEPLNDNERADATIHINEVLRKYKGIVSIPKNVAAQVMEADAPLSFYSIHKDGITKRTISGRPFIVLGMSSPDSLDQRGLTMIHELRHVKQTLDSTVLEKPRFEEDHSLSAELEAYNTQTLAMMALYYASSNKKFYRNDQIMNRLAIEVEIIRKTANKDQVNPFAASDAVKDALKQKGIRIVI